MTPAHSQPTPAGWFDRLRGLSRAMLIALYGLQFAVAAVLCLVLSELVVPMFQESLQSFGGSAADLLADDTRRRLVYAGPPILALGIALTVFALRQRLSTIILVLGLFISPLVCLLTVALTSLNLFLALHQIASVV